MSKSAIAIAIILVLGLITCGILYVESSKQTEAIPSNNQSYVPMQQAPAPETTPTPTDETANPAADNSATDAASSPKDTSDAALDKDLSSVDSQMQGLDTDSASIDSGLNDKPLATE
jgi:cytoskeletal protein RodZ